MSRLKYLLYKDFIMLFRDIGGIILMFIMPAILVVLMATLQDTTLNVVKGVDIPLLFVNNDNGALGNAVFKEVKNSGLFKISTEVEGKVPTREEMENLISSSKYLLGIYIPEGSTDKIKGNVQRYVVSAFNGIDKPPFKEDVTLSILVDPTAKGYFFTVLMGTLREKAQNVQFEFIMKEITKQVNEISPVVVSPTNFSGEQFIIDAKFARKGKSEIAPNSVQHNVPAWSLFAIFFIVISLSGSIIKEREAGSFTRLLTMPCSYAEYLLSKSITYLMVALLQFALMLIIGVYLLPLFGLPSLELGHSYFALFFMGFSAAVSAIGYGVAIGNIARTHQQASVFGAVSVVLLAAIGGVWIPVFLMSPEMQIISKLSPLNWGMSGFYSLFLRDEGIMSILPESGAMLLFGAGCFFLALLYNRKYRMNK